MKDDSAKHVLIALLQHIQMEYYFKNDNTNWKFIQHFIEQLEK